MAASVDSLVEKVAEEMQLSKSEQDQLLALANAWETVGNTMAEIEPDDDYSKDIPRLEKLEPQEEKYYDLRTEASRRVKSAMTRYLGLRQLDNRKQN